jgi:hypothetical protein
MIRLQKMLVNLYLLLLNLKVNEVTSGSWNYSSNGESSNEMEDNGNESWSASWHRVLHPTYFYSDISSQTSREII